MEAQATTLQQGTTLGQYVVCVFDKDGEYLAGYETLNEVFGPFTEDEADDLVDEWIEKAGENANQFHLVIQPLSGRTLP